MNCLSPILLVTTLLASNAPAALVNRWSFNVPAGPAPSGTSFNDSVSGVPLQVRGQGAMLNGSRITLPGTTNCDLPDSSISAYLNLPNGIASSKTNLTVEIWAAPITARYYQLMFDFGRMTIAGDGAGAPGEWTGTTGATAPYSETSDGIALLFNRETNLNTQRQGSRINAGTPLYLDTNLATTPGTTYHYVFTFEDTPGGGNLTWYRNGVQAVTGSVPFHLADLEDVNNWLGRSQWSGLAVAHAAYDEVRLHNHALSAAEVAASFSAGPDATFAPPVLQPDTATMHHLQKVRVNVLANDAPGANPATVEIVTPPAHGTAGAGADGRILYTHTTGTPSSDSFTYRANSANGFSAPVAVTVNFAASLRIPNTTLNVPDTPPVTTYTTVNAFPSLTFAQPINMATVPGDAQRLFVVQRQGVIRVIPNVAAATSSSVFLDLAALCTSRGETLTTQTDRGLMSMAFHPEHNNSSHTGYRRFFVFYSVQAPFGGTFYYRISRFTVQAGNPNAADTASEAVLIQQADPNGYHLGTDMHFGNDGYLYVSTGDGGGQFDSRRYGQRINLDFHCALLRLDVDKRAGNPEPNLHASVPRDAGLARYSVPADNPFVTTGGAPVSFNGQSLPAAGVRTEFYCVGLRNPFRFSIDLPTGEILIGDVGQDAREEINLAANGANFGWSWREGTLPGPNAGEALPGFTYTDPLYEYVIGNGEGQGHSVTGGIVYRGTNLPDLTGDYVFCDYVDGHIWALRRSGGQVNATRLAGNAGFVAFHADPSNGDVLMADIQDGRIYRLAAGGSSGNYPATLSETGLFTDVSDLSPAPGVIPYEVNVPFWSDHAIKRRWFVIPDAASKMGWSLDAPWSFTDGMIWVKHFDLEMTRGNPATRQRIETRLLVKNAAGSYGVSYRWNAAQTEATLVADGGEDFALNIIENGSPRVQNYRIPGRAECISCHNPQAGHALSFTTRQLNHPANVHGFSGNLLSLLQDAGYFFNPVESLNLLPRHVAAHETEYSVEARVRSYLDVNCANCHRSGGTATPSWDGRIHLTLAQTQIINGHASNNGGNPDNRLIVPGDTTRSIILNRVAVTNGFSRMPPLGSSELDHVSIALLTEWINDSLPSRQTYFQWRLAQFQSDDSEESEPFADADFDGADNYNEYLAGTNPRSGASVLLPEFTAPGTIRFNVPDQRPWQIETSTDLEDWSLWDAPGNNAIPRAPGPVTITGPATDPRRSFRVRLFEN
jgi:uncharacterized repeat protein (TIGR03806 family)